jgi:hypothetical protein
MLSQSFAFFQKRFVVATKNRKAHDVAVSRSFVVDVGTRTRPSDRISSSSTRSYVTRAHPRPVPEYPVTAAIQMVMDGIQERKIKRSERWDGNKEKRQTKGIQVCSLLLCLFVCLFVCYCVQ